MDSVLLFENSANRESDLIWTLHSRISGEAAVDGENNAGYEAGLALVAEEQQSTRQILGHAEATQGSVGDYLVRARGERAVLVEEQSLVLVRREEAGSYRIDSDADIGKMNRHELGEVRNSRLRRRVCGDSRERSVGVHGGDVENSRVLLAYHVLCKALRGEQRAEEVKIENKLNAFGVEVEESLDSLCLVGYVLELEYVFGRRAERRVAARTVDEDIT